MPPKAQTDEKTGPSTTNDPPTAQSTEPFENEFVVLLHGGFTVSNFETPEEANAYGVATYGGNAWWAILPVLKRQLPKEDDND